MKSFKDFLKDRSVMIGKPWEVTATAKNLLHPVDKVTASELEAPRMPMPKLKRIKGQLDQKD